MRLVPRWFAPLCAYFSLLSGVQAQPAPTVPTPVPGSAPTVPFRGGLHVQSMFLRGDAGDATKRIAASFRQEGFAAIETHADGAVSARSVDRTIVGLTMPFRDGVHVVLACVHDVGPAALPTVARVKELLEKAGEIEQAKAEAPAKDVDPKSLSQRTFRWGVETRPASRVLKFAPPAGMLVLEKAGLMSTVSPNGMVIAGDQSRAVTLLVLPAANELNVRLIALSTADDPAEATRLQSRALADWIKVLFE